MIEYLKKEIFHLRSKNYLLRTDLTEAKNHLSVLTETHSSTVASLEALYMQVSSLQAENSRLTATISDQKKELKNARSELNVNILLNKAEKKKFSEEINKLKSSLENTRVSRRSPARSPKRDTKPKSSIQSEIKRANSKQDVKQMQDFTMKRVSSTNRLKNAIKPSKEVPVGQWDRSGYDQLLQDEVKGKREDKRGSSKRSSKANSRVVTPTTSRPPTPTLGSFMNSQSSLATATMGKKTSSKSSLAAAKSK